MLIFWFFKEKRCYLDFFFFFFFLKKGGGLVFFFFLNPLFISPFFFKITLLFLVRNMVQCFIIIIFLNIIFKTHFGFLFLFRLIITLRLWIIIYYHLFKQKQSWILARNYKDGGSGKLWVCLVAAFGFIERLTYTRVYTIFVPLL